MKLAIPSLIQTTATPPRCRNPRDVAIDVKIEVDVSRISPAIVQEAARLRSRYDVEQKRPPHTIYAAPGDNGSFVFLEPMNEEAVISYIRGDNDYSYGKVQTNATWLTGKDRLTIAELGYQPNAVSQAQRQMIERAREVLAVGDKFYRIIPEPVLEATCSNSFHSSSISIDITNKPKSGLWSIPYRLTHLDKAVEEANAYRDGENRIFVYVNTEVEILAPEVFTFDASAVKDAEITKVVDKAFKDMIEDLDREVKVGGEFNTERTARIQELLEALKAAKESVLGKDATADQENEFSGPRR